MARDMQRRHGEDAAATAAIEEDRAWRHSELFEMGRLRRVRCVLEAQAAHGREPGEGPNPPPTPPPAASP